MWVTYVTTFKKYSSILYIWFWSYLTQNISKGPWASRMSIMKAEPR